MRRSQLAILTGLLLAAHAASRPDGPDLDAPVKVRGAPGQGEGGTGHGRRGGGDGVRQRGGVGQGDDEGGGG